MTLFFENDSDKNESYFPSCKLICEVMCTDEEENQKVFKLTWSKGMVKNTDLFTCFSLIFLVQQCSDPSWGILVLTSHH